MMGVNHALEGAAGGIATLPWCPHPDMAHQAAWVAAWTGSALMPDLDSKRSMASTMWGPASGMLYDTVSTLAGGHRHLTHDLILAPLLAVVLVGVGSHSHMGRMITVAIVLGLATRAILVSIATWLTALCTLLVSIAGAWWVVSHNLDLGAGLVVCIVGGILVHLAGDAITVARLPMPIAWIFGSTSKIGVGIFRAGKSFETLVVTPANLLVVAWLAQAQFGWWSWLRPQLTALGI